MPRFKSYSFEFQSGEQMVHSDSSVGRLQGAIRNYRIYRNFGNLATVGSINGLTYQKTLSKNAAECLPVLSRPVPTLTSGLNVMH